MEKTKKTIKKVINVLGRFVSRFKSIWPLNITFILLFVVSYFISVFLEINYYDIVLNIITLIITVYLLDFLYLEQNRRESANKRYIVECYASEGLIKDIISDITYILGTRNPKNNFYDIRHIDTKKPFLRENQEIDSKQISIIRNIISRENFWLEEINISHIKGTEANVVRQDYFKSLLKKNLEEINFILLAYGSVMTYENFRSIYMIREALGGYYLSQTVDLSNKQQKYVAYEIYDLLIDCKIAEELIKKNWL